MASKSEIGLTYNWMDQFFPGVFGSAADISCAFYDGDYSKTLEQAQRDKHAWVLGGLRFQPGQRVLDIGCGWGNMLRAVQQGGGQGVGWTIAKAQAEACARQGLNGLLKDWKQVNPRELDPFDGILSIGAFEHFCSIDEYLADEQERIYRDFFRLCRDLLRPGGRLYLQTMTWGKRVPDPPTDVDWKAPRDSERRILARLGAFYPGSWLPTGLRQIVRCATPFFELVQSNRGRQDYIQTLTEWQRGIRRYLKLPLHWPGLAHTLVSHLFRDPMFLQRPISILCEDQREVFVRKLFDHQRLFFGKLGPV